MAQEFDPKQKSALMRGELLIVTMLTKELLKGGSGWGHQVLLKKGGPRTRDAILRVSARLAQTFDVVL